MFGFWCFVPLVTLAWLQDTMKYLFAALINTSWWRWWVFHPCGQKDCPRQYNRSPLECLTAGLQSGQNSPTAIPKNVAGPRGSAYLPIGSSRSFASLPRKPGYMTPPMPRSGPERAMVPALLGENWRKGRKRKGGSNCVLNSAYNAVGICRMLEGY